ncbi:MAG: NADH-quinone oxidoreductase subunit C [Anaerolineales bacterium]|nr:NADH-quinone oxidoreductase subunit C [Anaerolineales bacterium]
MNTEEILNLASEVVRAWDWTSQVERPRPGQLDVYISSLAELVPVVVGLRVKRLGYLAAIVGLDLGPAVDALEVLYHFCPGDALIALRVRLPRRDAVLPSLCEVIPSAEVFERELAEMFGIQITGLHTPERLYLPDDWPDGVYPLRKDFDPGLLNTREGEPRS